MSTNYLTDFVDIKQIRHKISSRSQVQSHGDDFSNLTFIKHLLCMGHYAVCFAGVDNLLLPRTQGGVFIIPVSPMRRGSLTC